MARVLLGLVCVVGLAATGLGANIHFALPGTAGPVTNLDVDTGGGVVQLELHGDGQGFMVSGLDAEMANSSAQLLPLVHVGWIGTWVLFFGFDGVSFYSCFFDYWGSGPGDFGVATFKVNVPAGLQPSTLLRLTANHPISGAWDLVGRPLPLTFTDLVIHITPEPGMVGLLALGGMAAMRRRRGAR